MESSIFLFAEQDIPGKTAGHEEEDHIELQGGKSSKLFPKAFFLASNTLAFSSSLDSSVRSLFSITSTTSRNVRYTVPSFPFFQYWRVFIYLSSSSKSSLKESLPSSCSMLGCFLVKCTFSPLAQLLSKSQILHGKLACSAESFSSDFSVRLTCSVL